MSASADYLVFHTGTGCGCLGLGVDNPAGHLGGDRRRDWIDHGVGRSRSPRRVAALLTARRSPSPMASAPLRVVTLPGDYYYNAISGVYLATPYTFDGDRLELRSLQVRQPAPRSRSPAPGRPASSSFPPSPRARRAGTLPAVFAAEPIVTVEDSFGNSVTSSSAPITLSISRGSLGGCSANPVSASGGSPSFSSVAATAYGNGLKPLTAASSGLSSTTSASFNITNVASKFVSSLRSPWRGSPARHFRPSLSSPSKTSTAVRSRPPLPLSP